MRAQSTSAPARPPYPAPAGCAVRLDFVRSPAVRRSFAAVLSSLAIVSCGSQDKDTCQPDDADGVVGGSVSFDVTVDDAGFSPPILPAQNMTKVTLTLHNTGTKAHDFVIDCMPTPNDIGC